MRYECVKIIQKIIMIRKTSVSRCPFTDYFDTLLLGFRCYVEDSLSRICAQTPYIRYNK